jgi:L-ribulose-5-phosphate 4-epimerase
MLEALKAEVLAANLEIARTGLAQLTWGNVSGIDRQAGLVVIKPSGVDYAKLRAEDLVVLDLEGKVVEGKMRPSSDTPTHILLYRAFKDIGGVTHTHSPFATGFAQALREIPCLGTTHADHFLGTIPVTRNLTREEIEADYEGNTGVVIVERFLEANPVLNPLDMPAVLVAHHAPFTWGKGPMAALKNALALEQVAGMALHTFSLQPNMPSIPAHILDKHFSRKHGPGAYYGQPKGS